MLLNALAKGHCGFQSNIFKYDNNYKHRTTSELTCLIAFSQSFTSFQCVSDISSKA